MIIKLKKIVVCHARSDYAHTSAKSYVTRRKKNKKKKKLEKKEKRKPFSVALKNY